MKKIYCHTTYYQIPPDSYFDKYNWYVIHQETVDYVVVRCLKEGSYNGGLYVFYKNNSYPLFSNYFFTEQEYNRIKNLEELLDER